MSGALEKSLAILEYLTAYPDGASLGQIATDLNQLRSGCHRTLQELMRFGYVRQMPQRSDYALTTHDGPMGLSFLSKSGSSTSPSRSRPPGPGHRGTGPAGHRRRRAADAGGEGAGRESGLLYDPDMGIDLRLSCSAAGQAWLMTLPEDLAIASSTARDRQPRRTTGPTRRPASRPC